MSALYASIQVWVFKGVDPVGVTRVANIRGDDGRSTTSSFRDIVVFICLFCLFKFEAEQILFHCDGAL